jgi:cis-2,3-dihydrobiphenyl-2,3-diol dehydrogenase
MGALDNQVAVVTGGASGLGKAIVERFIEEGAKVAVLDRSEESCAVLETEQGDAVHCVSGDVRSIEDNQALIQQTLEKFGQLDCAVGNAGIWDYNISLADLPAEKLSDSFDELFGINTKGYLMLAKTALKPLAESKGPMIFTVSNAGFWPSGGGVLYTATKHAVVGMIRQLAFEFAPYVRVNGVAPGAISTKLKGPESLGMENNEFPGKTLEAGAADFVPLGRMPTPAEYAGAYVFFASRQDNVPSTGAILNHDGGFGVRGLGAEPRGGDDLMARL